MGRETGAQPKNGALTDNLQIGSGGAAPASFRDAGRNGPRMNRGFDGEVRREHGSQSLVCGQRFAGAIEALVAEHELAIQGLRKRIRFDATPITLDSVLRTRALLVNPSELFDRTQKHRAESFAHRKNPWRAIAT